MLHLCLWAIGNDLPVKVLAVIGAFTVGGFVGGWAVALAAKIAFNQKVPNWVAWTMRLLSGLVMGWLVWMWLFGPGGGGGGGGGLWPGGNGTAKDKADKVDKAGKGEKQPDTVKPPKDKEPEEKGKTDGSGIGAGETLRVEVLGNEPLEKLARGEKLNPEKRYRIAETPMSLRTFEDIKRLILERRSQTPPLQKLDVVIYLDSPDRASSPVKGLVDWARDLDPGVAGPLVVEEKIPTRTAPLK